jgi:hypothetical protein
MWIWYQKVANSGLPTSTCLPSKILKNSVKSLERVFPGKFQILKSEVMDSLSFKIWMNLWT